VLPVGRQVLFRVTSEDVIHSFWISAFGVKIDANPSVITTIQTTPTKIGSYSVRCAELCGLYHAYMEGDVKVVTPQAYTAWVAHQRLTNSTS
jgi:cytochrome c oxidase subunit 2